MDPTKLPTDNLYKFMAILGLLLMGFSVYEGRTGVAAVGKHAEDQFMAWETGPKTTEAIDDRRMSALHDEMEQWNEVATLLDRLTWVGGLVSALGFGLWYWKLQRYLDKAVADGAKASTQTKLAEVP